MKNLKYQITSVTKLGFKPGRNSAGISDIIQ